MIKRDPMRVLAVTAPSAAPTNIEDRISRWLEAVLQGAKQPECPVAIAIVHAAVDQSQRLLRSLTVEALPLDPKELADLVDTIAMEIATDAEDMGGMQRYQLKASAKGKDIGSTTVRYAMDTMPTSIDSEPPSHRGLVAQSQRHTEAAYRMLLQANGSILASLQQRLSAQEEMLARYQAQSLETLKLREELLVQRAQLETRADERKEEHELRMMEAIDNHQRKQLIWQSTLQKLNEMFPVVLQYLRRNKGDGSDESCNIGDGTAEPAPTAEPPERAAGNDDARPQTPSADTRNTPLDPAEKLRAAMFLLEHLVPLIVERHQTGQPLFQPAHDDQSHFLLARRLFASCSAQEIATILGSLPEPAQDAIKALANCFNVSLATSGPAGSTAEKTAPDQAATKAQP